MIVSFPPTSTAGSGVSTAIGNGQAFVTDGVMHTHVPRAVPPLWLQDASGLLGAPRIVMAPSGLLGPIWRPDQEPQTLHGNSTGDQVITMQPYRRYVIERIDVIDTTATASGLTFGLFANAGGTGIQALPAGSTLAGMTGDLRSRKTFSGLDVDLEAPHLYLNVTAANATPISFVMMIFGRVLAGNEE